MHRRLTLFLFLFTGLSFLTYGQDSIVLLSGKTIIAKGVEVGMYSITYHKPDAKGKQKRINPEQVFSIVHSDGTERIIYQRDSLEQGEDYTIEQMKMFIKGEQDAIKYYRNNINKIAAFASGAGVSYFGFYGIIGPAIYSTVVGSFSPVMEKQKVSDPSLIKVDEYRDGYERKVRDKKIIQSIFYGLAGFAAGVVTYSVVTHN